MKDENKTSIVIALHAMSRWKQQYIILTFDEIDTMIYQPLRYDIYVGQQKGLYECWYIKKKERSINA